MCVRIVFYPLVILDLPHKVVRTAGPYVTFRPTPFVISVVLPSLDRGLNVVRTLTWNMRLTSGCRPMIIFVDCPVDPCVFSVAIRFHILSSSLFSSKQNTSLPKRLSITVYSRGGPWHNFKKFYTLLKYI